MAKNHTRKLIRGARTARLAYTPVAGEFAFDTDETYGVYNGNDTDAGGLNVSREILPATAAETLKHRDVRATSTAGGAFTLTLPAGAPNNAWCEVFDVGGVLDVSQLSIAADTNIDGSASPYVMDLPWAHLLFYKSAGAWLVIDGRVSSFADTVAGWFPNVLGTAGQQLRINTAVAGFEFFDAVDVPALPATDDQYLLDIAGGTASWVRRANEFPTIATLNTLPDLQNAPVTGSVVQVGLIGRFFASNQPTPFFTVSGQSLTWNAAASGLDVNPGDLVEYRYTH